VKARVSGHVILLTGEKYLRFARVRRCTFPTTRPSIKPSAPQKAPRKHQRKHRTTRQRKQTEQSHFGKAKRTRTFPQIQTHHSITDSTFPAASIARFASLGDGLTVGTGHVQEATSSSSHYTARSSLPHESPNSSYSRSRAAHLRNQALQESLHASANNSRTLRGSALLRATAHREPAAVPQVFKYASHLLTPVPCLTASALEQ
jgi:hypothetical protein